ncbi:helix-turn-helix domain-containing protein [Streptomyces abyssomicinicus]|uniref:helix-turn-helix domain-containing protein n=1 Tax=Streptomyces abyssomicinicus TaxID=574929 RepID=UPI00124FDB9F|nr:helix-turn-helix domain-containing protein [Streptomyces abyssomicinicus]
MQIHRIPVHDRDFVIIANQAIQDRRLSHTARGILALILSLPNGIGENVRTLSDDYPQGRGAVAKAVAELRKLGYWVTSTRRDGETGRILSRVDVYELPGLAGAVAVSPAGGPAPAAGLPVATRPGTGDVGAGNAGTSPCAGKERGKDGEKPSLIRRRRRDRGKRDRGQTDRGTGRAAADVEGAAKAVVGGGEGGAGERWGPSGVEEDDTARAAHEVEAARVLRRLEAVERPAAAR